MISDISGLWMNMTADQGNQRQKVAGGAGEEGVQHLAGGGGVGRDARDQLARRSAVVEIDAELEQMLEHAALETGDHGVAGAPERDGHAVEAEAADEAEDDKCRRQQVERAGIAVDEDLVDDVLDEPGVEPGRRGDADAEEVDQDELADESRPRFRGTAA